MSIDARSLPAPYNTSPNKFITDFIQYDSYSGADIQAVILLPNETEPLILGELQTISVSTHRENTPVRILGKTNPCGFVKGARCLPATEKVLVQGKGYISIADIKPGDMVQSTGLNWNRVVGSYNQGFKSCVRIVLENGYELIASEDHPVMTNDGWTKAADLVPKDSKVHCVGISPVGEGIDLSDEMIKLVAYFLSDGTTMIYPKNNSGSEYRMSLSISDSEMSSIGLEVEQILNSFNIGFKDYRKNTDKVITRRINNCRGSTGSGAWQNYEHNEILETFKRFNLFNKKAHQKTIDNELIDSMNEKQIILFLSRLFATDGGYCISKSGIEICAKYTSTSEELIDGIRILLSKMGVNALKRKESKVGKVGGRSDIVSRHDAYSLVISNALDLLRFYNRIGIFGKDQRLVPYLEILKRRIKDSPLKTLTMRKMVEVLKPIALEQGYSLKEIKSWGIYNYKKELTPRFLLKIVDKLESKPGQDTWGRPISVWADSHIKTLIDSYEEFIPRNVKAVVPVGELPVYDLEVEDRHQFIANFMQVHNTIAGSMIFTQFNHYTFYRLKQFSHMVIEHNMYPIADMLPPFDIILSFVNETGSFSKMKIYGCTIVDEGSTMSIDDLIVESTYTYMASGIQPLTKFIPDGYQGLRSYAGSRISYGDL